MELTTRYDSLCEQLRALLQAEHDPIANMANMSALLYGALDNINWLGFYRVSKDELTLGPFQGKPACVHIPFGKGVCGTCAQQKKSSTLPMFMPFPHISHVMRTAAVNLCFPSIKIMHCMPCWMWILLDLRALIQRMSRDFVN